VGMDNGPLLQRKLEHLQGQIIKVSLNGDPDELTLTSIVSVEKTRQIIDQCITAYLLDRLKHDDGSTSSPVPSPPQSPVQDEEAVADGFESSDKLYVDAQSSSQTHPIQLPRGQTGPTNWPTGSRHNFSSERSSPNLRLYSRSSPGDLFGAHMERRDREGHAVGSNHEGADYTEQPRDRANEAQFQRKRESAARTVFKPLEDYILTCFGSFECINNSFTTLRLNIGPRAASEGTKRDTPARSSDRQARTEDTQLSELDAKTLLLGDFAENGSWWTGGRSDMKSPEKSRTHRGSGDNSKVESDIVTLKSPRIDWVEMKEWYHLALHAGKSWRRRLDDLIVSELPVPRIQRPSPNELDEMEDHILESQFHAQRVLLKATESLLKRPGRPLNEPNDLRFLLILLANPLLYPSHVSSGTEEQSRSRSRSRDRRTALRSESLETQMQKTSVQSPPRGPATSGGSSGQHSGIIKRIMGLLSNVPNECHHHLVSWFARYSDGQFQRTTDLIGSFVTYRLTRQHGRKREIDQDPTGGLIPNVAGSGRGSSAALHAALGVSGQLSKKSDGKPQAAIYNDDWQIKAAARVMALFFSANNSGLMRRGETRPLAALEGGHSAGLAARERAHSHGQILPTSDFYNTLLDYSDLIADFEAWESRRGKFAFCQYPFFLSIWAKIQIMEHDARRQMEVKAREAFFDSIMTRKSVNQYLVLRVRRDCLVEDSLKSVSEVVGTGGEEIKKGLRIEFRGEEGIDAGGLRKEWFLLLVRDVFNPEHGRPPPEDLESTNTILTRNRDVYL
jgi:E3 ubiquitin-protein ligase HECTD2